MKTERLWSASAWTSSSRAPPDRAPPRARRSSPGHAPRRSSARTRAAAHARTLGSVKAYYDRRAPEYDDWYLGARPLRRARPAGLGRGGRRALGAALARAAAGADARRRLRHRLPDAAPAGRGRRPRPERAMLEEARAAGARARRFVQGDALALPFDDGSFDRVFTGALLRPPRGATSASASSPRRARVAPRARRRRLRRCATDVEPEERQERILNDGSRWEVYKRYFSRTGSPRSSAAARSLFAGPLVRRRPLLTRRRTTLPLARLAAARQPRAAAPASRPATRSSRCRSSQPYAGQRAYIFGQAPGIVEGEERRPWRGRAGPDAAPLARARRGRVLRDLLLRVGHALLSGPRRVGPRRPRRRRRASRSSARSGATGSCGCSARG